MTEQSASAGIFGGAVPSVDPPKGTDTKVEETMKRLEGRVTQGDIVKLTTLENEVKNLKADLKARLLEGAEVEPGPYFAQIDRGTEKRSPSKTLLKEIAGEAVAEQVWAARQESEFERVVYGLRKEEIAKNKDVLKAIEKSGEVKK